MTIRRIEGGILGNGTEMKPDMTPFAAGLVLFIDMDKGDFVGRNALLGKDTGPCLLGLPCGTETPLAGSVVLAGTTEVGQITAGIASPTLGLGIGYVRFNAPGDWVGRTLVMRLADGSLHQGQIVQPPFFDQARNIVRGVDRSIPERPST